MAEITIKRRLLKQILQWRFITPLLIFVCIVVVLFRGLSLDSRRIPSALLDKPAPVFHIPKLLHPTQNFSNKDFIGHISLLNVWASWCASCHEEHHMLMTIARSGQVALYGLDYKDQRADAVAWINRLGNPYAAIGEDLNGRVGMDFGVYGTPETFVIDANGMIRYKWIGPITENAWQKKLLPLIQQLQQTEAAKIARGNSLS